jgi:hypothetical protein
MRQLTELQNVLAQLASEHRILLKLVESQHEAMKKLDLNKMGELIGEQESARRRITSIDTRRRMLMNQIAVSIKLDREPTLQQLATLFPPFAIGLLKARAELRDAVTKIADKTQMSGKLSAAVLGHLNTVMRILADAVGRAGFYTKAGTPKLPGRLGVMDAMG